MSGDRMDRSADARLPAGRRHDPAGGHRAPLMAPGEPSTHHRTWRMWIGFAVLVLLIAAYGCRGAAPHLVEGAAAAMGSDLRLTAWIGDEAVAHAAFDAVFREFDRLD